MTISTTTPEMTVPDIIDRVLFHLEEMKLVAEVPQNGYTKRTILVSGVEVTFRLVSRHNCFGTRVWYAWLRHEKVARGLKCGETVALRLARCIARRLASIEAEQVTRKAAELAQQRCQAAIALAREHGITIHDLHNYMSASATVGLHLYSSLTYLRLDASQVTADLLEEVKEVKSQLEDLLMKFKKRHGLTD